MRRALVFTPLLAAACFSFDADYAAYCAGTGQCDGGSATGGGAASVGGGQGGGAVTGGGAQAGGSAAGGGAASVGGGKGGGSTNGGGAATDGGSTGGGAGNCGGVQCTTPINGAGFCDAGSCDIACNLTFHRCGFRCAGNNDATACGAMCISCPTLGGLAVRACDAGTCDFSCINGYQRCGSQCLLSNSTQACGPACATCSGPGGSNPFCDAGSCDFNCQVGFMRVGSACIGPPVMTFPNIGDVSDPSTFIDARLDPTTAGSLWALDFSGQLLHSSDLAQTAFTVVCRLPGTGLNSTWSGFGERGTARLALSHGVDGTAYVTAPIVQNPSSYYGRLYRADMSSGVCTDVTPFSGSSYLWTSTYGSSFAVAGDGTAYVFDSDNTGSRVHRSFDRGATWTALQDAGTFGTYWAGYLNAGPGPDLLLSVFTGSGVSPLGLYVVTDGGAVFTRVSASIYGNDVTPRFSWATPTEAYANRGNGFTDGFVSVNGGASWSQSSAYAVSGDWTVDPVSNAGYRFGVYDGGVNVERAPDMHAPVWGRVNGFFPGQGGGVDRLDAVNAQVAAVVGGRLFVSSDSGATFRRVGFKPPLVGNATLDSVDGTRAFLVSTLGGVANAYESTDKGVTYALRYTSAPLGGQYGSGSTILLTRENPQVAGNVIAWGRSPSNTSDYDQTTLVTHDGFMTAALGSDTMSGAWGNSFSFSPSSLNTSFFYGNSSATSVNAGDSYANFSIVPALPFVWYPSAQVMGDPIWSLVFDCTGSAQALRVNNVTHTSANDGGIGNALGNDLPCSSEVYSSDGGWRARVISRAGWLATSDDNGVTFAPVVGSGTLPQCAGRSLTSLPIDRNTLFSWCTNRFWVSRNGGVSWTEPTAGPNWLKYGCTAITSLAPSDTSVLLTCVDRPPVRVAWP